MGAVLWLPLGDRWSEVCLCNVLYVCSRCRRSPPQLNNSRSAAVRCAGGVSRGRLTSSSRLPSAPQYAGIYAYCDRRLGESQVSNSCQCARPDAQALNALTLSGQQGHKLSSSSAVPAAATPSAVRTNSSAASASEFYSQPRRLLSLSALHCGSGPPAHQVVTQRVTVVARSVTQT
jgi:hypothetical protein